MEENGGLGGMSEEVLLSDAWDADEKICAVKHRNNEDYWVVLRKYMTNQYASFLVTEDGVNMHPVLSSAPDKKPQSNLHFLEFNGQIKISYDKKYLVNTYFGGYSPDDTSDIIE